MGSRPSAMIVMGYTMDQLPEAFFKVHEDGDDVFENLYPQMDGIELKDQIFGIKLYATPEWGSIQIADLSATDLEEEMFQEEHYQKWTKFKHKFKNLIPNVNDDNPNLYLMTEYT